MNTRQECVLIEDRLPNLLEHDLPAGETLLVRAHLDDCEGCATAFRDYEALARAIASDAPPQHLVAAAIARVRAALADSPAPERTPRPAWLLALVIVVGGIGFLIGPPAGASFENLRRDAPAWLERAAPVVDALRRPSFLLTDTETPR